MNYSGEAAEQVVRMSLNGVEVAAKISGKAAERLAVLLYAVLRDQKKTRGKIRLTNMLKSGKELKVFAVKDGELQKFCEEAKKYGVLYCVLKDNKANDGLTDIMVRAEDALWTSKMRVPVDLVSGVGIEATNPMLLGPVFVRSLNLNCLLKVLSPNKIAFGVRVST